VAGGQAGDRTQGAPAPGAQLRINKPDRLRVTAFLADTARGQLVDLELRRHRRAPWEDRVQAAKDTELSNPPLHDFARNQVWCVIVSLPCELTAWMQTLALAGH
jgi:predicted nucleic acid-binding Zn ribbon protein